MADEWAPKTRDDWVGLFADGVKNAITGIRSEDEEREAKRKAEEDKTGGNNGGNNDNGKSRSFADRLLGI